MGLPARTVGGMARERLRRGAPAPDPAARVVRGLAKTAEGTVGLSRQDLLDDATFNHDVYGFYGISVWLVEGDWTIERVLAEKLVHAPQAAVFVVADLYVTGLELWDTGQRPRYDAVYVTALTAADLVDRLLAAPCEVVDHGSYTQDPS